jgi:hypothetical protein
MNLNLRHLFGVPTRSLLDAWSLIGLPAFFAGMLMGFGGIMFVFGRRILLILDSDPTRIRMIPYAIGLLFFIVGFSTAWWNLRSMRKQGYLDVLLSHSIKLRKREGRR